MFVGLITYLGLEIQVFKTIDNSLLVIGISIFFIASILLFILTMNLILKNDDGHIKFKSPLYKILTVLLVCSIGCIAYENYLTHKDINQRVAAVECLTISDKLFLAYKYDFLLFYAQSAEQRIKLSLQSCGKP